MYFVRRCEAKQQSLVDSMDTDSTMERAVPCSVRLLHRLPHPAPMQVVFLRWHCDRHLPDTPPTRLCLAKVYYRCVTLSDLHLYLIGMQTHHGYVHCLM